MTKASAASGCVAARTARGDDAAHHRLEFGFDNMNAPLIDGFYHAGIDIDAEYLDAVSSQNGRSGQADIAKSNHRYRLEVHLQSSAAGVSSLPFIAFTTTSGSEIRSLLGWRT